MNKILFLAFGVFVTFNVFGNSTAPCMHPSFFGKVEKDTYHFYANGITRPGERRFHSLSHDNKELDWPYFEIELKEKRKKLKVWISGCLPYIDWIVYGTSDSGESVILDHRIMWMLRGSRTLGFNPYDGSRELKQVINIPKGLRGSGKVLRFYLNPNRLQGQNYTLSVYEVANQGLIPVKSKMKGKERFVVPFVIISFPVMRAAK